MQFRALLPAVLIALTLVAAAPVAVDGPNARAPMKYSGLPAADRVYPYKREEGTDSAAAAERDPELVDADPSADETEPALDKRLRYAVVKRDPLRYAVVKRADEGAAEGAELDARAAEPLRYAVVRAAEPEPLRYAVVKREPEPLRYAVVKRDPAPLRYAVVKRDAEPEPLRYAVVKREAEAVAAPKPQGLPAGRVAELNVAKRAEGADDN